MLDEMSRVRASTRAAAARAFGERFDALQAELEGPVAIAFGYDDLSMPSKLINELIRSTRLRRRLSGVFRSGQSPMSAALR